MTRALVITVHPINSMIRVGSWYYCRSISKYYDEVIHVSAPLSPFHFLAALDENKKEKIKSYYCKKSPHLNNVREHKLFSLAPAAPNWPFSSEFFFNAAYDLSIRKLKDSYFDFVYMDNPYLLSLLNSISYSNLCFRVPDLITKRESNNYAYIKSVSKIIRHSDYVISASQLVSEQLSKLFLVDSKVISNGVDIDRFNSSFDKRKVSKKVVFVGVIDYWVDINLIKFLSKQNFDLTIVGPFPTGLAKVLKSFDLELVGAKKPIEVAKILSGADVGIIPFDTVNHKKFVDGINPLKAYEYLAAGIPVVSTDFAGARGISPYVTTAATPDEFCQAVADYLDTPPDRDAVRKTAEPYDWSVVLKPFEDFVKQSLDKSDE